MRARSASPTASHARSSQGNFGDLLADGFGTDGGAQIGLEYRFGILSGTQIGVNRTSDKTIQFFGQHQLARQSGKACRSGSTSSSRIEGRDNFQEIYSPAVGAVVSRKLGAHGAVYVAADLGQQHELAAERSPDDNDTVMVGVGGRFRIRPKLYLVAEGGAAVRLRPWHHVCEFRHRDARRRTLVPDQLLERLRDHHGADGARRLRPRTIGIWDSTSRGSFSRLCGGTSWYPGNTL